MSIKDSGSVNRIAENEALSISFKPDAAILYQRPGPSPVHSGIFYVPMSSNQEGFDSCIVHNRVLYIFQFTISTSHPIKGGLVGFFSQEPFQTILQGKVIPAGGKTEYTKSSDASMEEFWKKVRLFSAEIDPRKQLEG